jgi:hypothetical protein
VLPVLWT